MDPHRAIDRYLRTEYGRDTNDDVVHRLRLMQWGIIGVPSPTIRQVHHVREMIESNLKMRR